MTFAGNTIFVGGLLTINFPGYELRLSDAGVVVWDGRVYNSADSRFGTVSQISPIRDGFTDSVPSGVITLSIPQSVPLATVLDPDFQNSTVSIYLAEISGDGFTVVAAEQVFTGFVDTMTWQPILREISIEFVAQSERFFLRNEGNVLSDRFHQGVWPGELGCQNCTDAVVTVAWGAESPTSPAPIGRSNSSIFFRGVNR